jgi:excisionase family DNA binding protein
MTKEEAAEYLRTTTRTIDRRVADGSLDRYYLAGSSKQARFRRADLDALMTTGPAPAGDLDDDSGGEAGA